MKKDILKTVIRVFHLKPLPELIEKDAVLPIDSGKIISVIGVRRSGKTSLLLSRVKTERLCLRAMVAMKMSDRGSKDESLSPISESFLKNSTQEFVSASILSLKKLSPFFLMLEFYLFFLLPVVINLNLAPQIKKHFNLILSHIFFHSLYCGFGFGFLAGKPLNFNDEVFSMFSVARIYITSLICYNFMFHICIVNSQGIKLYEPA